MNRDLLLLFAYHFPPENVIGAERPYRFYKYLGRLGLPCHVITAADVSTQPDLNAERVPDPFIENPRAGFGWQVERAIRKFLLPGVTGTQWAAGAVRAAGTYIDAHKNDRITIISTYPPLGTHLAAFWLSRKTGLPWIADFRDPLANNPGSGETNWLHDSAYRVLEKLFVHRAASVIANTDAALQNLEASYPDQSSHMHLVWNGFDPEQRLCPLPISHRTQRIFSHVGELYQGRVITPLLFSLQRLIDSKQLSAAEIQVQLIGPVRNTSLPSPDFLRAATKQGWLKIVSEPVPYHDARKIMQTSDGLILVQPHSMLQVPGKLFEYIQVGRPVLAYILPGSPAERILAQSGTPHQCVYASDPPDTLDKSVLRLFQLETTTNKPNEWFETTFNAQHHAETLFQIIKDLPH